MLPVQINLSGIATVLCRAVTPRILVYDAENLLRHTLGYVDYKYLIKWKLKNASLCRVSQIRSHVLDDSYLNAKRMVLRVI